KGRAHEASAPDKNQLAFRTPASFRTSASFSSPASFRVTIPAWLRCRSAASRCACSSVAACGDISSRCRTSRTGCPLASLSVAASVTRLTRTLPFWTMASLTPSMKTSVITIVLPVLKQLGSCETPAACCRGDFVVLQNVPGSASHGPFAGALSTPVDAGDVLIGEDSPERARIVVMGIARAGPADHRTVCGYHELPRIVGFQRVLEPFAVRIDIILPAGVGEEAVCPVVGEDRGRGECRPGRIARRHRRASECDDAVCHRVVVLGHAGDLVIDDCFGGQPSI